MHRTKGRPWEADEKVLRHMKRGHEPVGVKLPPGQANYKDPTMELGSPVLEMVSA